MAATLAQDSRALLPPVGFLALGTFAIGTEGFMIAPLLPVMAEDFALPVRVKAMSLPVCNLYGFPEERGCLLIDTRKHSARRNSVQS